MLWCIDKFKNTKTDFNQLIKSLNSAYCLVQYKKVSISLFVRLKANDISNAKA